MGTRTFLTVSQGVELNNITAQVQNSETLPNYTIDSNAIASTSWTSSEQFYRINDATFSAKVNVYASGAKVSQ